MASWSAKAPGILIKIVSLGALNAFAVWAIPILVIHRTYLFAAYMVISTLVLDYIFLSSKRVVGKYIAPGVVLLILFQVYPALYTGYVAFTNYSTGHILDKSQALNIMISNSYQQPLDGGIYPMRVAVERATGKLTLILENPNGTHSAGNSKGLTALPDSAVKVDASGVIISVQGFKLLSEAEVESRIDALQSLRIPAERGARIEVADFTVAQLTSPTLKYDPATDRVTDIATGTLYHPNNNGSMVSDAGDELEPGWSTTVGWRNFTVVFTDARYRGPLGLVLGWTFAFAILVVGTTFFLGLFLALVLNHPRLGRKKLYRSLLIVPYAMPSVLSILVWAGMFNQDLGVINRLFGVSIPWLYDPWLAKVAILIVQLWLGTPYMFLLATGAIQALPSEVVEAAQVDGASPYQLFSKIKLPLVLLAMAPLLIASFAFNFSNFGAIYLLTGGGPTIISSGGIAGHTDILISYTYKLAFAAGKGNNYGLASAVSFLNFLLVASISAYSFRKTRTAENLN
ncbi:MAG: ABC transporter permease subunit [Candidatus Nanopelagicaceae bacterium]|nr:ABC transporter permease subunit [Candidatus Nanopelagicaceae bacterium]